MFSRFLSILIFGVAASAQNTTVLRVCADPDKLPFSSQAREGFENRIAELLARELGARLEYTWMAERGAFIKNSLNDDKCDVLIGVPVTLGSVLATTPYYRSTYVFVARQDRALHIKSLYDDRLANLRIGIHAVGNDFAPPAYLLGKRGLFVNLVTFRMYGAAGEPNHPGQILEAVSNGEIDVAVVWGPLAGYFATRQSRPLEVTPVTPSDFPPVPFTFEISAAVRTGNVGLKNRIDRVLERQCRVIQKILSDYHVPQTQKPSCDSSGPARFSLR
jgi:quinoprotein dehydrogenase-associated probable ABC transporter substrate-binding protein